MDILQYISAGYKRILMKFFRTVGRSRRTNQLHFGVDLVLHLIQCSWIHIQNYLSSAV